ncbi:WD40 repeat-like protein [Periconia macrospinosa]|uniref:ASTRA-associated protein 1 n=1 Tax=Periconia macrospinosa TaxID=97972 RepID=A0A2V1DWW3_9PLEO|nr:WD40 repeat-like protein [Periconia macrospinosa]
MAEDTEQQASTRGPAQPSFVFRGHTAQIHSARIVSRNTCLVTGDADGWVVIWRLETKRALAVWKAHDGAILETAMWGNDKFITHGRDHNLRIWQLDISNASNLSRALPAEGSEIDRPKPWLLHSLPANTLNFCAFSMCYATDVLRNSESEPINTQDESVLIAVPARDDKKVEVYQFPQEKLICVVPKVESKDTGMVMAVKLVHHSASNDILIAVGYEGGFIAVYAIPRSPTQQTQATRHPIRIAQIIYLSQPHTQPVLSLDVLPASGTTFFTSSADAVIAKHQINYVPLDDITNSSLERNKGIVEEACKAKEHSFKDGDAATTSDTDAKPLTLTPPIPTHQHTSTIPKDLPSNEDLDISTEPLDFKKKPMPASRSASTSTNSATKPGGLSSLLSGAAKPQHQTRPAPPLVPKVVTPEPPYKFMNTKHAGQQSLRVRSDGRLLVTGGWDKRVRVYSTKTLKEVAVLKWHSEGVYAVDFGEILDAEDIQSGVGRKGTANDESGQVSKRETGLGKLQRQREERMQMKHWVVAGAKDGKVSLWEVF